MNRLQIKGLSTRHIGPIDLDITGGQCVILSGTSGSGKTMLLRAIADLDLHEGEIYLDDLSCKAMAPTTWRQQVGLLVAESQWWENVVGDHFNGEPTKYLGALGLDPEIMSWSIARLSSGERQRLGLVRLLNNQPKVLLLDEPTANLDPEFTKNAEMLIKQYQSETGAAIIWVTHHHDQIERIADRHFSMKDGQLKEVELKEVKQ
ncbi:MAG: ATP-binding cassette domain-containing protein [Gammaproteobacteria bacterium]|nr:ATP-binding cassette domain-containing protein [Gammaproteobacteria bacterium]MCK5090931.1 ATP-binding cassette domain-containing protein [Gammaproteobacteria bacterium]